VYAIIRSGGKQYRVAEGDLVRLEKLEAEAGSEVEFSDVLLLRTDDGTRIGQPVLSGASVKGVIETCSKGETVLVFKYKKKKQYRRTRGHRQQYSDVRIQKIEVGPES